MTSSNPIGIKASTQSGNDVPVVLAGYRLLRFSPAQWRAAAASLTSPLARLGQLRRVQAQAWQAAIGERDCGGQEPADECGGGLCA